MNVVVAPTPSNSAVGRRIRVMIVDDSVVVRGLFARWVEPSPTSKWSPRCVPAVTPSIRSNAPIPT